jgi:thiamine-monophosphate kinase
LSGPVLVRTRSPGSGQGSGTGAAADDRSCSGATVGPATGSPCASTDAVAARPSAGEAGEAGEFALIARYFARPVAERRGIGDDCALIDVGDRTLALTADLLVEGTHFFADVDPESLGHKALAVNLSDLAAAGATPRCFLLSLGLPDADPAWLAAFSHGLLALADAHGCALVGGDTTRMPPVAASGADGAGARRVIGITAIGEVPRGAIRTRAGARPGDDLWVSGTLGDAALAVAARRERWADWPGEVPPCDAVARDRLDRPAPRVALGLALRGLATAAIDVSDGLVGDLGHIAARSGVGAHVDVDAVPARAQLRALPAVRRHALTLAGGDDYELLFTAQPEVHDAVVSAGAACGVSVTRIGRITDSPGIAWVDARGVAVAAPPRGYDHFAGR